MLPLLKMAFLALCLVGPAIVGVRFVARRAARPTSPRGRGGRREDSVTVHAPQTDAGPWPDLCDVLAHYVPPSSCARLVAVLSPR